MNNDQLTRGKLFRIGGLLLALMTAIFVVGIIGLGKLGEEATTIASAEDAVTQSLLADMAHDATAGAVESAFRAAASEDPADDASGFPRHRCREAIARTIDQRWHRVRRERAHGRRGDPHRRS
jgi:hypothetical protein